MKTFCFSAVLVCVLALSVSAQECANGTCDLQQSTPVVDAVVNTTQVAVRVATAPVRYLSNHKPIRRFVHATAHRVRYAVRSRCCR